jgi:hypothetical protein
MPNACGTFIQHCSFKRRWNPLLQFNVQHPPAHASGVPEGSKKVYTCETSFVCMSSARECLPLSRGWHACHWAVLPVGRHLGSRFYLKGAYSMRPGTAAAQTKRPSPVQDCSRTRLHVMESRAQTLDARRKRTAFLRQQPRECS